MDNNTFYFLTLLLLGTFGFIVSLIYFQIKESSNEPEPLSVPYKRYEQPMYTSYTETISSDSDNAEIDRRNHYSRICKAIRKQNKRGKKHV